VDFSLLRLARKQLREFQPDLVHGHLHEGAFIALLAADRDLPIVLDYQGSLSRELAEHRPFFGAWPVSSLARGLEGWINSRVDRILLNSSALMNELGQETRAKTLVVGDGVDTEGFAPQRRDEELGRELGLLEGIPVVVYLGLLNRYQGVDLLLRSAQILARKKRRAQFLIMGYPLGGYRGLAAEMGLADMVKFSGRIDYFSAAKFLALGELAAAPKIASSEANGKILNYLAMGLPLICFDRPVNRDLAGECAEYVEFDPRDHGKNAENFARGIERLLEDPKRRKDLAEKGRARAEQDFKWERVAGKIQECYRELLG
jgi:glycosyltransferase involved in cell wall biosynthesis